MVRRVEDDAKVTRRSFLGGAAAGVAAGAVGNVSLAAAQAPSAQEMRTDVVVCGTGIAGMTAAIRAQAAGARVIVLEKAYEPGGTTAHSEGTIWTAERYENMRQDAPGGDANLQRTVFDTVPEVYKYYESLGVPISAARAGSTRMRSVSPVAFTNFMVRTLQSKGGTLMLETPMLRLLTNRQNEVIGVLAENAQGQIRILAKAVVLATGGWAGNANLINQHITRHFAGLNQRNASFGGRKPFLTGDGLMAALQVGAAVSEGSWDGFYGHMMPAKPHGHVLQNPLTNYSTYHGPYCVVVNLYGRRFADETYGKIAGRKLSGDGGEQLINQETARQAEAAAAYIWDEPTNKDHACSDCGLGDVDKFPAYKEAGAPTATANTLEELTQQMERWNRGIPAETVMRELNEYNTAVKNGKAWAMPIPKASARQAVPIQTPPFYAILGQSGITATHGGIRINTQGQVLSRGGRPITGLYAAGVDCGNINDYVYLGNLCLGATFGYIGGALAGKQPEPRGGWEIA